MVPDRVIEVVGREQRRDRLEMRRLHRRSRELSHREVADAEHADIAVAPRLGGDPFDEVVKILPLLAVEQGPRAAGAAGAAGVDDKVDVAARNEEVGRAGLYEAERSADVLNLARIRGEGDERRKGAVGVRLEEIGEQRRPVAHGDADIVGAAHREGRLAEVAVFAPRRLDAVETTFPGSETGGFFPTWPSALLGSAPALLAAARLHPL